MHGPERISRFNYILKATAITRPKVQGAAYTYSRVFCRASPKPRNNKRGNGGMEDDKKAIDLPFLTPKLAKSLQTHRVSRPPECHFCTIIRFIVGNTDK